MKKTASAVWKGDLKSGQGTISSQSGALKNQPYGFNTRFADQPGTNPEELLGAAHAGCFSMALSNILGEAGLKADSIEKPLRSGQRVYARHTDLIVIGMVSQGAEVIADGNVHVYGPLRGKAMAGARGDTSARIFTTQLDAELLAVAGVYRVVEDKLDRALHNQPALVRLDGDTLRIEALKG